MLGDEQARLDGEVCLRGAFLRSHISHKSLTFVLIEPAWILPLIQSTKLESENSSAKDEIFQLLFCIHTSFFKSPRFDTGCQEILSKMRN